MKLITFALWGQNPKYLVGAIRNAELAAEIYPDWKCRFYIAASVPPYIVYELEKFDNVQIVQKPEWGDWTFSFNRFFPMSEDGVEVMISRDVDSRLTRREEDAVNEWLNSDKGFHIMRDHPWHYTYPILAGMFGCKKDIVDNISTDINLFTKIDSYHSDQEFLKKNIYPKIKNNVIIHDEFSEGCSFPTPRQNYEFVGQVFNENEQTVEEHLKVLKDTLG